MNDDPTAGHRPSADDDRPARRHASACDVPRSPPTPDPRPDARWAWASPHRPARRRRPLVRAGAGEPPDPAAPAWGAAGADPTPARPAGSRPSRPPSTRRGPGLGTVVAASLLSAVLASGGTVVALDADRRPRPAGAAAHVGSADDQPAARQQPVTIDESSAMIDVAAKLSPAVVRSRPAPAARHRRPVRRRLPATGIGSGRHLRRQRLDPHQPPRRRRRDDTLTVELKDGREFDGQDLRHRHADRPRDRQGRRRPTCRSPRSANRTGSRSASWWSRSAARWACTRTQVTSGIVSGKGRDITRRRRARASTT